MKNRIALLPTLLTLDLLLFSGCTIIGDIFKTGVGVGIFLVLAVIAIIAFVVSKMKS